MQWFSNFLWYDPFQKPKKSMPPIQHFPLVIHGPPAVAPELSGCALKTGILCDTNTELARSHLWSNSWPSGIPRWGEGLTVCPDVTECPRKRARVPSAGPAPHLADPGGALTGLIWRHHYLQMSSFCGVKKTENIAGYLRHKYAMIKTVDQDWFSSGLANLALRQGAICCGVQWYLPVQHDLNF